jgi:hypothetical protein
MPFPLTLVDFNDQSELMRINPDASITVLNWNRVIDLSLQSPDADMGFLIAMCQVLYAARDNFVEIPVATSDALGAHYTGDVVMNVKGEKLGPGPVYGMTQDFVWQVNWKLLETIHGNIAVTDDNAAMVGFLNMFFAARDNFLVQEYVP